MTTRPANTPNLVVALSGGGRTLVNLQRAIEAGTLHARIAMVVASRDCGGVERAQELDLPVRVLEGEIPARELEALLDEHAADLMVLAGYLRFLHVPHRYRGRVINIHPSLLPAFGGKGMYGDRVHAAVLEAFRDGRATETGCTAHMVDGAFDTGPIISQARVPIETTDTVQTLAARVFDAECELYPAAISEALGRLRGSTDG